MTEFNPSPATAVSLHLWDIADRCQQAQLSGRALRKVRLLLRIIDDDTSQAPFLAFALFSNHSKTPTTKQFLVSLENAVKRQLAEKTEVAQTDDGVKNLLKVKA